MWARRALILVLLGCVPGALSAAAGSATENATYAEVIRADSPSGYWRLGEEEGTTAADSSGRGHAGTYGSGVVLAVAGALVADPDTAVSLPGGTEPGGDMVVQDAPGLDFGSGDFTAEAWVRSDVVATTTKWSGWAMGDRPIIGKFTGLGRRCVNAMPTDPLEIASPGWVVSMTDDEGHAGQIRAVIAWETIPDDVGCWNVQKVEAFGPPIRVDDGQWHHVGVVFERASGVTVYVDGVPRTTDDASMRDISNAASLRLGSGTNTRFAGDVDEAAVYPSALDADRIAARLEAARRPEPDRDEPSTDGIDTPGVVASSQTATQWSLSNGFDGSVAHSFSSGCCGRVLASDWDGDGIDSPGLFDGGRWSIVDGYDDFVDVTLTFGTGNHVPVAGDWNGDGIDTPGVFNGGAWSLSNTFAGTVDASANFGQAGDVPVVGDWNGDGSDTIGVRRGNTWYLSNSVSSTVDVTFAFGEPGDAPVVGDWNGNGTDTPGVRRGSAWYLSDDFSGTTHRQFAFGADGTAAVAGDWDSEQVDEGDVLDSGPLSSFAVTATPDPVSRYAPVVYLNEDYDGDWHNPSSARTYFIKRSSLRWARISGNHTVIRGRGRINSARLGDRQGIYYYARSTATVLPPVPSRTYATWRLTRPYDEGAARPQQLWDNEGFFLDLRQGHGSGQRFVNEVPVYYDYVPGRYIRYWLFYPFSVGELGFNHEGDWEGIAVRLNSSNVATHARLYRHADDCGQTIGWQQLEEDPVGTEHRVVYSARGSHGTYAEVADRPPGRCGDDTTARGARWATWLNLANVRRQPWYGFGGAWGEIGSRGDSTGPVGPSRYKRPAPIGW
jgi:hypothetical protein